MSDFAVRRARPADAEQIADVFLAARAEMTYLPHLHTDEETRGWIATVVLPTRQVWVAEAQQEAHWGIAGFAALLGDHLDHLYVRPGSQGRGIGSALLAEAKAASPNKLSLFVFARNTRARAFYERHGFTPVAFGDGSGNEEREPDVRYEWSPHGGAAQTDQEARDHEAHHHEAHQEAREQQAIEHVTEVLTADFSGDHSAQEVEQAVDEAKQAYADAPVRPFVPILVERDARTTLSRDAQDGLGEGT